MRELDFQGLADPMTDIGQDAGMPTDARLPHPMLRPPLMVPDTAPASPGLKSERTVV